MVDPGSISAEDDGPSPDRRGAEGSSVTLRAAAHRRIALVAAPLIQRFTPDPRPLIHLDKALPLSWNLGFGSRATPFREAQNRASELYERYFRRVREHSTGTDSAAVTLARRPNVIIFVLESFNASALSPDTMPRLWEWSRKGTRLTYHHSSSNSSTLGLFSLGYGWYGLNFWQVVEKAAPSPLISALRAVGYEAHYLTGSSGVWRGLGKVFGPLTLLPIPMSVGPDPIGLAMRIRCTP
jgi:hypothetical protein